MATTCQHIGAQANHGPRREEDGQHRLEHLAGALRDPAGSGATRFTKKFDAERHLGRIEGDKLRGNYLDPAAGRVSFQNYDEQWRAT